MEIEVKRTDELTESERAHIHAWLIQLCVGTDWLEGAIDLCGLPLTS
jgi:hypothetical protein